MAVAITRLHNKRYDAPGRLEFAVLEQTVSRDGVSVFLPPKAFRLALCLAVAGGNNRHLSTNEMIDAIWADDVDGGPETADTAVSVYLCRLRKLLVPVGVTIVRERQRMYLLHIEPALEAIAA